MSENIKIIKVQAGQTITDIAIQEYGNAEGMILILQANPDLSLTDNLIAGQELVIFTNLSINLINELVKVEPYASQMQSLLMQWATLIIQGQAEQNHVRLHAMDSALDHAQVQPQHKGMIPQADPITGIWKLVPMPNTGSIDTSSRLIYGTYTWVEGLIFNASNTIYQIWGNSYTTLAIQKEHDAADPDLPRIDTVCLNIDNEVVIIKGTPAENPAKPIVDPFTQLEFTQVLIPAGSTVPGNITNIQIFDENVEWQSALTIIDEDATSVDFESIVTPFLNSKCLRITKLLENGLMKLVIKFTSTEAEMVSADAKLLMQIRSSAYWVNTSGVSIQFKHNDNTVGNPVILLGNGAYGNITALPGWHLVTIPVSDFGATLQLIDEVEYSFSYTDWGAVGFTMDIDDVKLQTGVVVPPVVAATEIIIPKLQLDSGRYRVSTDPHPITDTLRCFWQQHNQEFLKYNPEVWLFRGKRNSRKVDNGVIIYRKLNKKWAHPPHLLGVKFIGGNYFAGDLLRHPVTNVASTGYHTEWALTAIEPLKKMVIPIDQFEFISQTGTNDKLTESVFHKMDWGTIRVIGKGSKKSLAFRFAIVIDNPDANSSCPKLIGQLSDTIYLVIHRDQYYGGSTMYNKTAYSRSYKSYGT